MIMKKMKMNLQRSKKNKKKKKNLNHLQLIGVILLLKDQINSKMYNKNKHKYFNKKNVY